MSDQQPVSATLDDADFAKLQAVYQAVYDKEAFPTVFAEAVDRVDWETKPAEMFGAVIRMALMVEALGVVRYLSKLGARLYPDDEFLARSWKLFGPPTVRLESSPPIKGQRETMMWLQQHAHEYSGHWIAVKEGQLIAMAASFDELLKTIGGLKPESNVLTGNIP